MNRDLADVGAGRHRRPAEGAAFEVGSCNVYLGTDLDPCSSRRATSTPLVHAKDRCGGWTSGQDADLLNEVSTQDHRIDTIFLDPEALTALQAEVIGDEQRDRNEPSGFWPSDHAGSIARLRTVRP